MFLSKLGFYHQNTTEAIKHVHLSNPIRHTQSFHVVNELFNKLGFSGSIGSDKQHIKAREGGKLHQIPRSDL